MSVVQFPVKTPGGIGNNGHRKVRLGSDDLLVITPMGVRFVIDENILMRNEAIEAAKAILIAYDVPFCNRVTPEEAS